MSYKVIVKGYDSGLNELLNAQKMTYDRRTRRVRVHNSEKRKNDTLCEDAIRKCRDLRNVRIKNPVFMRYKFYVPNKKRDRSNYSAAFIKSFEDALQHCGVITNDTYDLVLTPEYYFEVDKDNPRVEVEIEVVDTPKK